MHRSDAYAKAFVEILKDPKTGALSNALPKLRLFLENRGESHLYASVIKSAVKILEEEGGTRVLSRYPLSVGSKKHIGDFIKKNFGAAAGTDISFEINSEMLGGVEIRHEDFLFDGTIDSQLRKISA